VKIKPHLKLKFQIFDKPSQNSPERFPNPTA